MSSSSSEDREVRKKILGLWTCEESDIPHTVKFRRGGKLFISMSTSNLLGGVVAFFSGEQCEGTWTISKGNLRISFDRVPKSWMNQKVRMFGFGFEIPGGDMLAKAYSICFSLLALTNLEIMSLDNSELHLSSFKGKAQRVLKWSREVADS